MSAKYNIQALGTIPWLRHSVRLPTPIANHYIGWGTHGNRINIKSGLSLLSRVNVVTKQHH